MSERNELYKALSAAQGEIENASKNKQNPHFKSKYADLAECINATKEALAKNNLCVIQLINQSEKGVVVETTLGHSSGQSISSITPLIFSKNDMQGMGSAITYARRYAFSAIVGLSQEDDDANGSKKDNNSKQNAEPKSQNPFVKPFITPEKAGECEIQVPGSSYNGSLINNIPLADFERWFFVVREKLKNREIQMTEKISELIECGEIWIKANNK